MIVFKYPNLRNIDIFRRFMATKVQTMGKESSVDVQQEEALNEKCLLVDENDNVIGSATKRDCHAVKSNGDIPLHRAFSVFLFNSRGDLLLQRRSGFKVTYPDYYTNTCCSHPLADIPGEDEETDALGIKRAAQRRLNYELGIPMDQIQPKDMFYLTRILYKDTGDGVWGEHEVDYIIFIHKDVTVKPNPNEISAISYIPHGELHTFLPTLEAPLTPWFNLIVKNRLLLWWDNLNKLDKFKDHEKIWKFQANL